jgi:acetyl esterase/lipase
MAVGAGLLLGVVAPAAGASGPAPAPGIVLVHPGGFTGGTGTSLLPVADRLRAAGYAVSLPDYTLSNVGLAIRDVRRAAWVFHRQGRKVVLWGFSAGGTLAAAVAVRGHADGAVIASSPTNLVDWRSPVKAGFGNDRFWAAMHPAATLAQRFAWSPVNRIRAGAARMLMFLSDDDPLVGVEQASELEAALQARGVTVDSLSMGASGHSFSVDYQTLAIQWIARYWPVRSVDP